VAPDTGTIALKLRQDEIEKLRRDTDGDGLQDWEEILYRTDPAKEDTDGDGTPDGEEVKSGRDPLRVNTSQNPARPDDYIATSTPMADGSLPSAGAHANLTADFTRTFFRQPLAQMLAGGQADIDTKSVERYADRLQGKSVLADAPRFLMADIKIDPQSDDQTIRQYLASIKTIFNALNARGRNEMDVVAEALTSQDYSELVEIASYPDAYQRAIMSARSLTVPKELTEYHLTLLNYLGKFKRSTELLQQMETDPVLGILTINERLRLNNELAASLTRFQEKTIAGTKK
jgi:hypothetical protein